MPGRSGRRQSNHRSSSAMRPRDNRPQEYGSAPGASHRPSSDVIEAKEEVNVPPAAMPVVQPVDVLQAIRDGTVGTSDKIRWFFDREIEQWRLCVEVCRGQGQVLIIDFSRRFRIIQANQVVELADSHSLLLSSVNAQAVVSSLCRLSATIFQMWPEQIEMNVVRKPWMRSTYTERVHVDSVELLFKKRPLSIEAGGDLYEGTTSCLLLGDSGADVEAANASAELTDELTRVRSELDKEKRSRREASRRAEDQSRRTRQANVARQAAEEKLKTQQKNAKQTAASLRRQIREKEDEITAQRSEANRHRADSTRLNRQLRESQNEVSRLDHKLESLSRENEQFRETQYKHERAMLEFQTLKKNQKQLEMDNGMLREVVSELKGGSRDLGSAFWSPKEILRARKELIDEYHDLALAQLEEEGDMELTDGYDLLWALFEKACATSVSKFDRIRDSLCLDGDQVLHNVFLPKIQEHFLALIDEEKMTAVVIEPFTEKLGDLVDDEAIRTFVLHAVRICWALVLTDKPAMEFYPMDTEVRAAQIGNVLRKSEFDAEYEAHTSCSVRRATYIRVSGFVLPGVRRVGGGGRRGGKSLVPPCVIAEKAQLVSRAERGAIGSADRVGGALWREQRRRDEDLAANACSTAPLGAEAGTKFEAATTAPVSASVAAAAVDDQDVECDHLRVVSGHEDKAGTDDRATVALYGELEHKNPTGGETINPKNNASDHARAGRDDGFDDADAGVGPEPMDVDEEDVGGDHEAGEDEEGDHRDPPNPEDFNFTDVNALLTEGHYDEAWDLLIHAGFDIERGGSQAVMLCCGECVDRTWLGRFDVDGEYICDVDAHHYLLQVDSVTVLSSRDW